MNAPSGAEPGFAAILNVCEATNLEEASIRGEHLGWLVAPEDRDWRTSFERHNGFTVRVVGWRRSVRQSDGLLSYWVASGPNAHTASAFSTDVPGLLEALRHRFGAPDTLDEQGNVVSAFLQRGRREVSFTQVGANRTFNISRRG
jgi:hypothetical protein